MTTRTHVIAATAPALALALGLAAAPASAQSRDQIRAVGSSTVFPFTTAVAEAFGKTGKFKTPVVESTGTGGGLKLFCAGVGPAHPDIANASRRIKKSEIDQCTANGVTTMTELKIGYDGIALASSKKAAPVSLSTVILWKALAKEVPVDQWPMPIVAFALGNLSESDLLQAANVSDPRAADLTAEAEYYIGAWALAKQDKKAARQHFKAAVAGKADRANLEFIDAGLALQKLGS